MPLKEVRTVEEVLRLPRTPEGDRRLAAMLRHDGRHFKGLSTADAEWVRGHIFAAFEQRDVPDLILHSIREELRTSLSPVVLAGAARALRQLGPLDEDMRALLVEAFERIALRDEYVRFEGPDARSAKMTASQEIAATLVQASNTAPSCCGHAPRSENRWDCGEPLSLCPVALGKVEIEDQYENKAQLFDILRDRTSLIAFFYTRCMNPAKCSLTITRLAAFSRHLHESSCWADLNLLAFSYDSEYDFPTRLRRFGADRGFPFSENARLIRCLSGWNLVMRAFKLQVGYGTSNVNEHAREFFLVSPDLLFTPIDTDLLAHPDVLLERVSRANFPMSRLADC